MNRKKIEEILFEMPFSVGATLLVVSVMKTDLLAIGFRSFYIFTPIASHGNGKTSLMRSLLKGNKFEGTFYSNDRIADVKKKMLELHNQVGGYDDFTRFSSTYQRQKAASCIDMIVRLSYSGEGALLFVTAETEALKYIPASCRDRMFMISVEGFLRDEEKKEKLNFLNETSDMEQFLKEFSVWYLKKEGRQEYAKMMWRQWREKRKEEDARTSDMVFLYHFALSYVRQFFEEEYGMDIPKDIINKNCDFLFETKKVQSSQKADVINVLINRVLQKGFLKISKPYLYEVCERYCSCNCTETCEDCYKGCARCEYDFGSEFGEYYLPQNILLPNNSNAAVLLEKPTRIYQFPRHITDLPLLVVRDNVLLSLVNSELECYCTEKAISIPRFSQKALHKALIERNMCLYRCISRNHLCYNFGYYNCSLQPESVVFLRLTQEQYQTINEKCEMTDYSDLYRYENRRISDILGKWKSTFENMYALAGPIGELGEVEDNG